jgi:NTE family protein
MFMGDLAFPRPNGTGRMSQQTGSPRIGLALGGGGARGIAHVHALAALD